MVETRVTTQQGVGRQLGAAFVIPFVVQATAGAFGPDLVHAGLRSGLVMSLCFYAGLLAGIAWQVFNRRDFVDRFLGWALLLAVVMILPALPGVHRASGVEAIGSWSWPGVVVGLLLAEGWMRQKHRP